MSGRHPIEDHIIVTTTTLDEIARVISELGFRHEPGELNWLELMPECKTLKRLIRERAELGHLSCDWVIEHAALLILEAMVAQNMHDLTLAAQSLPPFGRGKAP